MRNSIPLLLCGAVAISSMACTHTTKPAESARIAPLPVVATTSTVARVPKGVVRLSHVDPDYMKRLEPAAVLDALRAARS